MNGIFLNAVNYLLLICFIDKLKLHKLCLSRDCQKQDLTWSVRKPAQWELRGG